MEFNIGINKPSPLIVHLSGNSPEHELPGKQRHVSSELKQSIPKIRVRKPSDSSFFLPSTSSQIAQCRNEVQVVRRIVSKKRFKTPPKPCDNVSLSSIAYSSGQQKKLVQSSRLPHTSLVSSPRQMIVENNIETYRCSKKKMKPLFPVQIGRKSCTQDNKKSSESLVRSKGSIRTITSLPVKKKVMSLQDLIALNSPSTFNAGEDYSSDVFNVEYPNDRYEYYSQNLIPDERESSEEEEDVSDESQFETYITDSISPIGFNRQHLETCSISSSPDNSFVETESVHRFSDQFKKVGEMNEYPIEMEHSPQSSSEQLYTYSVYDEDDSNSYRTVQYTSPQLTAKPRTRHILKKSHTKVRSPESDSADENSLEWDSNEQVKEKIMYQFPEQSSSRPSFRNKISHFERPHQFRQVSDVKFGLSSSKKAIAKKKVTKKPNQYQSMNKTKPNEISNIVSADTDLASQSSINVDPGPSNPFKAFENSGDFKRMCGLITSCILGTLENELKNKSLNTPNSLCDSSKQESISEIIGKCFPFPNNLKESENSSATNAAESLSVDNTTPISLQSEIESTRIKKRKYDNVADPCQKVEIKKQEILCEITKPGDITTEIEKAKTFHKIAKSDLLNMKYQDSKREFVSSQNLACTTRKDSAPFISLFKKRNKEIDPFIVKRRESNLKCQNLDANEFNLSQSPGQTALQNPMAVTSKIRNDNETDKLIFKSDGPAMKNHNLKSIKLNILKPSMAASLKKSVSCFTISKDTSSKISHLDMKKQEILCKESEPSISISASNSVEMECKGDKITNLIVEPSVKPQNVEFSKSQAIVSELSKTQILPASKDLMSFILIENDKMDNLEKVDGQKKMCKNSEQGAIFPAEMDLGKAEETDYSIAKPDESGTKCQILECNKLELLQASLSPLAIDSMSSVALQGNNDHKISPLEKVELKDHRMLSERIELGKTDFSIAEPNEASLKVQSLDSKTLALSQTSVSAVVMDSISSIAMEENDSEIDHLKTFEIKKEKDICKNTERSTTPNILLETDKTEEIDYSIAKPDESGLKCKIAEPNKLDSSNNKFIQKINSSTSTPIEKDNDDKMDHLISKPHQSNLICKNLDSNTAALTPISVSITNASILPRISEKDDNKMDNFIVNTDESGVECSKLESSIIDSIQSPEMDVLKDKSLTEKDKEMSQSNSTSETNMKCQNLKSANLDLAQAPGSDLKKEPFSEVLESSKGEDAESAKKKKLKRNYRARRSSTNSTEENEQPRATSGQSLNMFLDDVRDLEITELERIRETLKKQLFQDDGMIEIDTLNYLEEEDEEKMNESRSSQHSQAKLLEKNTKLEKCPFSVSDSKKNEFQNKKHSAKEGLTLDDSIKQINEDSGITHSKHSRKSHSKKEESEHKKEVGKDDSFKELAMSSKKNLTSKADASETSHSCDVKSHLGDGYKSSLKKKHAGGSPIQASEKHSEHSTRDETISEPVKDTDNKKSRHRLETELDLPKENKDVKGLVNESSSTCDAGVKKQIATCPFIGKPPLVMQSSNLCNDGLDNKHGGGGSKTTLVERDKMPVRKKLKLTFATEDTELEKGSKDNETDGKEVPVVHSDDSTSNNILDSLASDQNEEMEFDILDEFECEDENEQDDDNYEGDSDISTDEIDAMLEESLLQRNEPNAKVKSVKPLPDAEPEHEEKQKIILKARGRDHFDVLPEGWIEVTHNSGMPIYLHKPTRVCCVSKPYFLGPGSTRRHEIPVSAIPCLHYWRELEKEKEQAKSDQNAIDKMKENIVNGTNAMNGTADNLEENGNTITVQAKFNGVDKGNSNPVGSNIPSAKLETVKDAKEAGSLNSMAMREYCQKRFEFQTITVKRFRTWSSRRKHQKQLRQAQRPLLPDNTKLITCPLYSADKSTNAGNNTKKEFIMNPSGKSPICILHEYVQHALKVQPKYIFKELENANTPYGAVVILDGIEYGCGFGSSKKLAKADAAKNALDVLIPRMRVLNPETNREESIQDVDFFDQVRIEDPRVSDLSVKAGQSYPYQILLECLKRNYGMGDTEVEFKMKNLKHQKNEFYMRVGKHEVSIVCKNKRDGKHRASQCILQKLHPHINSWGSLLRMYGKGSCKTLKEKKDDEQKITELQSKACANKPNMSILNKLKDEMLKYREKVKSKKPIGKLIPERMEIFSTSSSNLKNVEL